MQLTPNAGFSIMPWSKSNMICSQQRRFQPLLRICAALLLFVWIAASGQCSVEHFFSHTESAATPASATASHSHDSDKHDDSDHTCCDSLKATPQLGGSIVLNHPDFGKLLSADFLSLAQTLNFVQPEAPVLRQPLNRERVFTPEVYLGPAFHSLAPPFAV